MTGSVQKSKFRETTEKERSSCHGPGAWGRPKEVRAKEHRISLGVMETLGIRDRRQLHSS